MQIILVSDRMATARSITLDGRHLALMATGLFVMVIALSSMFSYLTVRHAAEVRLPFLQELLRTLNLQEASKTHELVRENLSTMAVRLGEMQGQLMQLDSLGERLAGLAGVKAPDAKKQAASRPAGSGGPLTRPDTLSQGDVQRALEELAQQIEARSSTLTALEEQLFDERIRKHMLPTSRPIDSDARASLYGWRADPFTGESAMHEGIDFLAEPGTPILAAAAGIVVNVERHPQYGNMIDLDHGNNLITRYAHARETFVKPGQLIKRGQRIASVGSTGRSTGPHLHFEVRISGVAQNPARFLDQYSPKLSRR